MRLSLCLRVFLCLLALTALGCSVEGQKVLAGKGCLDCHRFKGVGGSICPDLTDVTKRRSDVWIRQQIINPSENNPDSKMPGFSELSEREIQALLRYLKG